MPINGTVGIATTIIQRAAAGGLLATLAIASPASAAAGGTPCAGNVSQPFAPWGDMNLYTPAPGGDLETGANWTLAGGAAIVPGSEPFSATSRLGSASLSLPAGASAVSPEICLTVNHPTFRFFAKAVQGDGASLRAEALADRPSQVVALGALDGTTGWAPTAPLSTGASNLRLTPSGLVRIRLRFTADQGDWQIDDIFVDPRKMG